MKTRNVVLALVLFSSALLFVLFMVLLSYTALTGADLESIAGRKRIAIIEIYGVISDPADIVRQLKKYGEDESIPGIVLHINSPGGGVAASQEIYEEIGKIRENGKKVITAMSAVAASGGYYVACATDTIVANPGTLTGSIGVVFEWPVATELLDKVGLKFEVVKSGSMKDVGSFSRDLRDEEREMLQSVVDDTYEQFVDVVATGRGLPIEDVYELADGRIFTGNQALQLGLVDMLGDYEDAVEIAGRMAGIEGEVRTVRESQRRPTIWDLLNQKLGLIDKSISGELAAPRLRYIVHIGD